MNLPSPAIVTERAALRLPRWALLTLCVLYILPGLVGRDPWRFADVQAFATMDAMARGWTSWLTPEIAGLSPSGPGLPTYWLGALSIQLFSQYLDWLSPAMAARLPFALLLVGVLALSWYATYYLARTEAAQPVAFAFGGEAHPTDYARAIADGALLALIASFGLLQLGHETTPELMQLFSVSLALASLATIPYHPLRARWGLLLALPLLASCGAPSIAFSLGLGSWLICRYSRSQDMRQFHRWVLLSLVLTLLLGWLSHEWRWRLEWPQALLFLKSLAWFFWPTWPLALWTLWRWRSHWSRRHISAPLSLALILLGATLLRGGSIQVALLATPPLAVLAAFALPTLKRSWSAFIDWFTLIFFTGCALVIWGVWLSLQTGLPPQPAANVARIAPGFVHVFAPWPFLLASAASVGWIVLVHWRVGRHRHPIWKSLVLPASGVTLCWLLLMTLWLPILDYAQSDRLQMTALTQGLPEQACVQVEVATEAPVREQQVSKTQAASFQALTQHPLKRAADACPYWLVGATPLSEAQMQGAWTLQARVVRRRDHNEVLHLYRRLQKP